jgi:hypothetical protein
VSEETPVYVDTYALEKMVESRLAELRAEAARRASVAPSQPPKRPDPDRPRDWIHVQILGR